MMLITLDEAKEHLRIDDDFDNQDLELKIRVASAAVMRYLKSSSPYELDDNGDPKLDDNDEPVVLYEVKGAVCLMLGELYKNREGQQEGEMQEGYGYLPRPVVALLYPLRDPAIG